jgi:hypothetical protein
VEFETKELLGRGKARTGRKQTTNQVRNTDGDENVALITHSVQDPSDHRTTKYTAENMQTANTWRSHGKPVSNLQQIVRSPFELVKSMEGNDKDPKDVISDICRYV